MTFNGKEIMTSRTTRSLKLFAAFDAAKIDLNHSANELNRIGEFPILPMYRLHVLEQMKIWSQAAQHNFLANQAVSHFKERNIS